MPETSEFDRKLQAALTELEATGMWRWSYNPPEGIVSRKVGFRVRPPHYRPFWRAFFGIGLYFGIIWGIGMWIMLWRVEWSGTGVPWRYLIVTCLAGTLFGLSMALSLRRDRRKYRLSKWDDL